MGKKTIKEWESEFEKAEGNKFEKSLELFRQYCGFIPNLGTNIAAGIFGQAITGRWRSHNADSVHDAIMYYYPNTNTNHETPERSVATLLEEVRVQLSRDKLTPKEDGDLSKIIQVIRIKTGEYMRPINEAVATGIKQDDIDIGIQALEKHQQKKHK